MVTINVRGHEFNSFAIKGSSSRRAVQFRNNIIEALRKLGVPEDDIDVPMEAIAIRRVPASVSWYMDGEYLYFTYKAANFIENLYVVSKVIELEVEAIFNQTKTIDQFIYDFREDNNVAKKQKDARKLLGVEEDSLDLDLINKKYKELAKSHHPDMGGNPEKFKKINNAHKLLKRELQ